MTVLNELALICESCSVDIPMERSCSTQDVDKWCLELFWPLPKCQEIYETCTSKIPAWCSPTLRWGFLSTFSSPNTCCSYSVTFFQVHWQCLRVLLCCYVTPCAYTPWGEHASLIRRTVPNCRHAELMCTLWKHCSFCQPGWNQVQ